MTSLSTKEKKLKGKEKMEKIKIPEYDRTTCPSCGNNNPKHIRELDDKTKPLYFSKIGDGNNVYAKKYNCNDCRKEWTK